MKNKLLWNLVYWVVVLIMFIESLLFRLEGHFFSSLFVCVILAFVLVIYFKVVVEGEYVVIGKKVIKKR